MGNASAKNARRQSTSVGSHGKRAQWGAAALPSAPGKPILIPVASEDSQPDVLSIRWERSASNGGSAIIGYLVEHRRLGSPHWVRSSPTLCTFPELTLSGLEPGWRYQFRVRAQNGVGLSHSSELSDPLTVTLQRSAATAPRFDLELKDTTALENEQAEFIVHFSGTPIPKISWFKDGFEIFSSRRTRIVTENGKSTLLIHQTALNDEGDIKCTATNRAGHVSTRAKLLLEAPPRIRLPRQYEDGLLFEQGETVRLKVSMAGRPSPNVLWYHDGELIKSDEEHVIETFETGECSLRIRAAKRKDRGEYTVKAINKLGEDVSSFLVTVTDRPAAPGKATIAMTLGRSVTLSWAEPEDDGGCKIGTYIVEYYRIGWDVWLKAATCRQATTTLSELIEGSEYKFRVKAENPYGVSDASAESDVIFIPDPKRGINAPPLRPDKSQSQRDIHRGRAAQRRENAEPTKRTRSLTREEATRGHSKDDFQTPPSRSSSAQRLVSAMPTKPARADSRVTFADTVFLHVEKPLEDEAPIARPRSKREKNPHPEEIDIKREERAIQPTLSPPKIVRQLTVDETTTPYRFENFREKSLSPIPPISTRRSSVDERRTFKPSLPREETDEDDEEKFRGSSEFMLVLYPDEETGKKNILMRSASEGDAEDEDDDLVPPPLSQSLPELFSAGHQIIEVLREAVSSTELLHERAMERFYKAVAVEEAEAAKKSGTNVAQKAKEGLDFVSERLRSTRLRRRPSAGSPTQSDLKAKWIRRRSSEGQASPKPPLNVPSTLLLPNPQLVASDPNLPQDSGVVDEYSQIVDVSTPPSSLHRWDEKTMPLVPGISPEESEESPELVFEEPAPSLEHFRDPKTPDREIVRELSLAEDYEESTEDTESDDSESSEDLKTLKSRLLAKSIVDEEDTYHPRGRPIPYVPSTDLESNPVPLETNQHIKPSYPSNNTVSQPKSILKKRTEDEPVPVNQFGRPIPPEKAILERQPKTEEVPKVEVIPQPPVTLRKSQSPPEVPNFVEKGPAMTELDSDNASLVNAAEVAKSRRRPLQKPVLEKKPSIEEKEDLEARKAMIDHYTEIVREYSLSHAVHPPPKYNANGRMIQKDIKAVMNLSRADSELYSSQEGRGEDNIEKKEDTRVRKNSTGSRGVTPAREDPRPSRRDARSDVPASKSRNTSGERSSGRSTSITRTRQPSQDTVPSRSSSRTRMRDSSGDRAPAASSRSSSRPRREPIAQVKPSSRTSSRDRGKSVDPSPSDSETSQKLSKRKIRSRRLGRSRRNSSMTFDGLDDVKNNFNRSGGVDERLMVEANSNVRSTISFAIDLAILVAATYVYLFKHELLAIPFIGLLLYRHIHKGITAWIPKRWRTPRDT